MILNEIIINVFYDLHDEKYDVTHYYEMDYDDYSHDDENDENYLHYLYFYNKI